MDYRQNSIEQGFCEGSSTDDLFSALHACNSPEATKALGYRLASKLLSIACFPVLVFLKGEVGLGKTVFAQGFAQGLGIAEPLPSPTFPILLEYQDQAQKVPNSQSSPSTPIKSVPLYHFDLYRLADSEEFNLIGGEDILFNGGTYGPGVSLLEWPERLEWAAKFSTKAAQETQGAERLPLPCFQVILSMAMGELGEPMLEDGDTLRKIRIITLS